MKKFVWLPLLMAVLLTGCTSEKPKAPTSSEGDTPKQENSSTDTSATVDESQTVFFWGDGCSHCENVEKYFADNGKLDEKLGIKKMEVFKNKANQELFMKITKKCGIGGGVPVLYRNGKCTVGDTPIIDELKKIK